MISRRTGAAFAAVFAALSVACDDNPIAEGRGDASRLFLSHTNAVVEAGGNITVVANVLNRYGAPTGAGVTAQACDNRITVTPDPARTPFENPERFTVTGASFGASCIVISGGGITDTVGVRVVPASVRLTRLDTLGSGESLQTTIQFLGAGGQPVPGLTIANATFVSRDTTRVTVDAEGNLTGRAPGATRIVATFSSLGVVRSDSFTVVVAPGTFNGTVARSAAGAGAAHVLTFTAGTIPYDADTQVRFSLPGYTSPTWFALSGGTATTRRLALPFGLAAGTTITYDVINLGPNQVAQRGTFTLTTATPAEDPLEPDESFGTPKVMMPGDQFFGTLSPTDDEDVIRVTITEAGTYTVTFDWDEPSGDGSSGSDFDMYVLDSAGATLLARETFAAAQETGNVTLEPGNYFIDLVIWEYVGRSGFPSSTYRVTVVKQ